MAEYKLRTIKDIVDKVPPDRVSECMAELTVLIIQASSMSALMSEALKTEVPASNPRWVFPEEIIWLDDEAGIIQNTFHLGETALVVTTERDTIQNSK